MAIFIIQAEICHYDLYILERLSLRIRHSWPRSRLRLSLLSVLLLKYIPVCPGPPSTLLFVPMDWVSQLTPSLLSGRLLINVQVNNMEEIHDTHGHTYICTSHQYYYSSSSLHFFHSSWQAGWLRPFPSGTLSDMLASSNFTFC
jgi:hypothetical protein